MSADGIKISGLEANFLLFALDNYLGVDANGHIFQAKHGYTRADLQALRDRLFNAHEHPDKMYDEPDGDEPSATA